MSKNKNRNLDAFNKLANSKLGNNNESLDDSKNDTDLDTDNLNDLSGENDLSEDNDSELVTLKNIGEFVYRGDNGLGETLTIPVGKIGVFTKKESEDILKNWESNWEII